MVTIHQIDWVDYQNNLVGSIENEKIWAMAECGTNFHSGNVAELQKELQLVRQKRFAEVLALHEDDSFWQDFLLSEAKHRAVVYLTVKLEMEMDDEIVTEEDVDDIVNELDYSMNPADHHKDSVRFVNTEITESRIAVIENQE